MPRAPKKFPALQLRLKFASSIAFGPGKAELLQHIADTGSISAAARNMAMSYKRAWQLVDEMNRLFRKPLVTTAAGGAQGGGAALTPDGTTILESYRAIQRLTAAATKREVAKMARMARGAAVP